MEWYLVLLFILGSAVVLMLTGLPIAFCLIFVNLIGAYLVWGGVAGLDHLIHSIFESVSSFYLLPIPLFVLMGEVVFYSGIGPLMLDALGKWLGKVPGRLALLGVGGGTLLATMTGTSMGSVAILGSVLVPEMEKRGYAKPMSLGSILGSGGLAIMIPPSGLAVLLGAIGGVSIAKLLMAIIMPGIVMAALYGTYIILRSKIQPSIAPPYEIPDISQSQKLIATIRYILPTGFIIFLVIGVILLGVASPTEAAATGALGCFILAALYRRLNWETVRKSIVSTLGITVMILMILTGAKAFAQILSFTGATRGLADFIVGLPLHPILVLMAMQVVILFLGCFLDVVAIMMLTLPIFMPVVHVLGFNSVWFATIFLINIEVGLISPPFGMSLFVMKGVAPADTTMGDIYRAAFPFLCLDLIAMALIIAFPQLALWLPSLLR